MERSDYKMLLAKRIREANDSVRNLVDEEKIEKEWSNNMAEAILTLYDSKINNSNDDDDGVITVEGRIFRNMQSSNINYCGYAPEGSSEDEEVWTITKIIVALNGTLTKEVNTNTTWSSVPF